MSEVMIVLYKKKRGGKKALKIKVMTVLYKTGADRKKNE